MVRQMERLVKLTDTQLVKKANRWILGQTDTYKYKLTDRYLKISERQTDI